jgi:trehalose 6-phosphate phosphatase
VLDPLLAFIADPSGSALVFDLDGTLAPITATPDASRVASATRGLVTRLVACYALVGVVSGRAAADAAALLSVPGVAVVGNHGLETLHPAAPAPVVPWRQRLVQLGQELAPIIGRAGARGEDKSATMAVHYRTAPDPEAARRLLADEAVPLIEQAGFRARFGRMVLDIVPDIAVDKGTAVRALLTGAGVRRSLYAGDDTTDLDAFGVVDVAVCVRSAETPAARVTAATLVIDAGGVDALLARLASAC